MYIYIHTHIIIYNCIIHILYNDYNDSPSKFGISCFLFRQTQLKIYGFSMGAIFCESMKKLSAVWKHHIYYVLYLLYQFHDLHGFVQKWGAPSGSLRSILISPVHCPLQIARAWGKNPMIFTVAGHGGLWGYRALGSIPVHPSRALQVGLCQRIEGFLSHGESPSHHHGCFNTKSWVILDSLHDEWGYPYNHLSLYSCKIIYQPGQAGWRNFQRGGSL